MGLKARDRKYLMEHKIKDKPPEDALSSHPLKGAGFPARPDKMFPDTDEKTIDLILECAASEQRADHKHVADARHHLRRNFEALDAMLEKLLSGEDPRTVYVGEQIGSVSNDLYKLAVYVGEMTGMRRGVNTITAARPRK